MNSWLIGLCLAFFFIFPTNNLFFVVNILFLLYSFRYRNKSVKNKAVFPFIIIMFFSYIINMAQLPDSLIFKESFRIINIIAFLYITPIALKRVDYKIIGRCLFATLLFIFISQLAFLFAIQPLVDFIDKYYPYEGDALGLTTDYILERSSGSLYDIGIRYSGIYRNPNQCSRYVVLLTSALLYISRRYIKIISVIIALISVLMTGSRTGFLVLSLVVVAYMFYAEKRSMNILWIVIGAVVITFLSSKVDLSGFRAVAIEEGVDTSLATKFVWFLQFITQENSILYLLFGHGTSANVAEYGIPLLDSEWGMAIFSYGIIGFAFYIYMLVEFFKKAPSKSKAIFVNLLWIISSTVFLSYRMNLVFVITLSLIWQYVNQTENINIKSKNDFKRINQYGTKNMAMG